MQDSDYAVCDDCDQHFKLIELFSHDTLLMCSDCLWNLMQRGKDA